MPQFVTCGYRRLQQDELSQAQAANPIGDDEPIAALSLSSWLRGQFIVAFQVLSQ